MKCILQTHFCCEHRNQKKKIGLVIPSTPSKKCKYSSGFIAEDTTPSKRFRLYQAKFKTSSKNVKAQTLSVSIKKKSR